MGSTKIGRRRENLKKYGMTIEQYEEMLDDQFGLCAVCFREPTPTRRLAVDHHHATGRVRGLLCGRCNVALGLLDENVGRILELVKYLKQKQ